VPRESRLAAVAAAIAAGQVIGERTALALAEQAIREDAAGRRVAAHSNQQVLNQIATALGQGPGDESDDAYSALFPPSQPLGHQVQDTEPPQVPGDGGRRKRKPAASAWPPLTDDQLHAALFADTSFEDRPALGPVD
jgi:hypothetical protein